jgi:RNA polymerase sigma-70 factor (ECF subfamily)
MDSQERLTALHAARQGDGQALGKLLESFRPYIRVIVHALKDRRLQARIDDSDLIQDALLEAQRTFASFNGTTVEELAAWLHTVVVRTTGRTLRRYLGAAKRDPAKEQSVADMVDRLADSGSSPSAQAIRNEEAVTMAEKLAQLPEDMQQVLLGRHLEALPYAAIGERLKRSEQATRMLYVRAMRRLRELYCG